MSGLPHLVLDGSSEAGGQRNKPGLMFWTVYDDTVPWGIFCWEHVDPSQFSRENCEAAIRSDMFDDYDIAEYVALLPEHPMFQHRWITQLHDDIVEADVDEETPWHSCGESSRGARAVTIFRDFLPAREEA